MISALLLAAGSGRRFGGAKLLQDLDGKPVLRWTTEALAQAGLDEIIVVTPPGAAAEPIRAALGGLAVRCVANPRPELEIASSIACGVLAVDPRSDAALVALGDQPTITARAIRAVIARYRAGGARIVVPTYAGVRGHPVLFDRATFDELRTVVPGGGARAVVDRDPARAAFVEMDEPLPPDVDTPDDLARLRGRAQFTSPAHPSPS